MNEVYYQINEFLKRLRPGDFDLSGDAINWAGLRCSSVAQVKSWVGEETPSEYILVTIEDAAPGSSGLHRLVEKLCEKLLPGEVVEVHTEW